MYTKPVAPRGIGGVLDSAFSLWLPTFKKTWLLALIPQVLSSLVLVYEYFTLGANALTHVSKYGMVGGHSPSGSFFNLLVSIVSLGFYNAQWARADNAAAQGNMGFGESLSVGFSRWGHTFGLGILLVLFMVPFIIPVVIIVGQAAALAQGQGGPAISVVLFTLAYSLVIIWVFGRVFLAFPLVVIEDETAWAAVRASWDLTRHHWWRCAAVLTVIAIVSYVAFFVFGLVLGIVGARGALQGGITLGPGVLAFGIVTGLVTTLIFAPLMISAFLSLYYDLKLRKEGSDLAGRVEALGSGQA